MNKNMTTVKDPELHAKVKKTTEKISENMHIIANEPSLAFYRIQEHVRKVIPLIVDRRAEVVQLQQDLQGKCYDMEYAIGAVKDIEAADDSLKNVQELLKNAIFLKQQLKYVESRRPKRDSNSSVYKRLSAHITLDLPDLTDFSGVVRETTNRVEHMMSQARNSNSNINNNSTGTASTTGAGPTELQRSYTTLH
ncbi:BLOC-1-related complex subunit 8 homolog [Anopheles ziemanni]|uniref:BLOC-1-related complex subunit 8 homolog n=1 Tax=Anopheles coustani TaxID=139045 RepID=UPI002658C150|nr:BLOC-1-related complex subunit 8 homolog [Anopheles coustani]XP_058168155.1 BLOC-1-related complex subunit 8 homolog [Anopheles ziemanni]